MDNIDPVNWAHMVVSGVSVDAVYGVFKGAVPFTPIIETTIVDLLPAGMTYVSSTPAGATATIDPVTGRTIVRWHFDDIALDTTYYKIVVNVAKNRSALTDYINTATVDAAGQGTVLTNATYHRMKNVMKLHIRQMVLNRNGTTVPLPGIGYYNMQNNGVNLGLDSLSGLDGVSQTPFTEYILPLSTDVLYAIQDLIPQYYTYAGYVATPTNATHNSASRSTGSIVLNYTNDYEQWLTVYLIPAEPTGKYTWDIRTNDFGHLDVPLV
jgi:hypothetical protein